jgi:hypothetical protein
MLNCNFTQFISPNTCVGDSLETINQNFSALDNGLCIVPQIVPGNGTTTETVLNQQGRVISNINANNSVVYGRTFDTRNVASYVDYQLLDGSVVNTLAFPYISTQSGPRPEATFSTVSLSNKRPQVTLYWLASGVDAMTVYATNSSIDTITRGSTWFNGPVTALHRVDNLLFVGGEFTNVGGFECKKFAVIALNLGTVHPTLSTTGQLASSPFSNNGDLGDIGTVNTIATASVNSNSFIIIGGSFQSATKGIGLSILNTTTGIVYPFFVNGQVNTLMVDGTTVYVGGDFNYLNYGIQSASEISGLRRYTKGLTRINLQQFVNNAPEGAIDQPFTSKVVSTVSGPGGVFNAITTNGTTYYFGGNFQCKDANGKLIAQNLIAVDSNFVQSQLWRPIISGPVHTLVIDDTTTSGGGVYLYIGGSFDRVYTVEQFYPVNGAPRDNTETTKYYNAAAVRLQNNIVIVDTVWKPRFNGPVVSLVPHDNVSATIIYAYGNFTAVGNEAVAYTAAISKATDTSSSAGNVNYWRAQLETAPYPVSNSMLRFANSVIIGGNFTRFNDKPRYYLARVNGYGESLTTSTLSAVAWDFNAQVVGQGMPFGFTTNATQTVRQVTVPNPYNSINCTTFTVPEEGFENLTPGQLCRFYIRRPGDANVLGTLPPTNDSLRQTVNIVGWKVDFN